MCHELRTSLTEFECMNTENKGRVDFDQGPDGVDVTMTISYKLPTVLALMFR